MNIVLYLLDYVYKEITSTSKDILTEIYLNFFKHNRNQNKKILAYWDFNQRMSKLGDFITYLEYLNILRYQVHIKNEKNKNIDLCFIDDNEHYNKKDKRFQKTYNFKKNMNYISNINKNIDSVMFFRSNTEFYNFYLQNKKRYIRWPPTVSGTLIVDCRAIEKFYLKNNFIPILDVPLEIKKEIYSFYKNKVYPSLPIIINIRNNNIWDNKRNTEITEIKKFLEHYQKNELYKFIIIYDKSEITDEFRELKNVIFSKDHFSDIEYDLALIKTSFLSIFPSSGMACMAWFGDVPFIQHGPHGKDLFTRPKKGGYVFFNKYQRHFESPVTTKWLISTFENLIEDLKKDNIDNNRQNNID